jgi:hypothetical protein
MTSRHCENCHPNCHPTSQERVVLDGPDWDGDLAETLVNREQPGHVGMKGDVVALFLRQPIV